MTRFSDEDLERIRRSNAMLQSGQPSSLSRDEAMDIIEELQQCRRSWRRLTVALADVRTLAENAVGRARPSSATEH